MTTDNQIFIACEASEAVAERFPKGDVVERVEIGPFAYVQLTYGMLRVDEDHPLGDATTSQIGEYSSQSDVWLVWVDGPNNDPKPFSDIILFTKDRPA